MPYTVLACRKNDQNVLLHTHLTNRIIRRLIEDDQLPAYRDYRVVKEEVKTGQHRFDLLLEHKTSGLPYYLEVKSCTLFAGQIAMFPDAITSRGAAHLLKLAELAREGIKTGCLFAIMNPEARWFLPAYHIDPKFTSAFLTTRDQVQLEAIAIGFNQHFTAVNSISQAAIPYTLLESEAQDRGAYLLIIRLSKAMNLMVGSLGLLSFKPGYYLYCGSAMGNLTKRVARHLRKRKKERWHIDYLTSAADSITAAPVLSSTNLECKLAETLSLIAEESIKGFGSSDCHCPSHLFYFNGNPLHRVDFIDLIQHFRILRLEPIISATFGN